MIRLFIWQVPGFLLVESETLVWACIMEDMVLKLFRIQNQ